VVDGRDGPQNPDPRSNFFENDMMTLSFKLSVALCLFAGHPAQSISVTDENESTPYGVDCSFPIHHHVRTNDLKGA
jgi:hypothetical protein